MMNKMSKLLLTPMRSLTSKPAYSYYFPHSQSQTHHKPGLTAKRIIKCISERLKGYDPDRWEGVPFSFNTNWRDQAGYLDVETSIQVHEALEREFGIEIKDRHILISDIQTAYYIVNQSHDAV